MTTTPDIIDVVPFEKNPRRITKQRKKDLRENLARFGDLGGIVVNIRTGESISGNQRCAVMDVNACERVISKRYDKPNAQGTVAVGYVLFEGDEFSYREVDWDDETAAEAAIKANVDAGFFEADLLVEHYDVADLMDWGLDGIIPESDLEAAASRREEIKETDNPPSIDEAVALRKKWGTETGQLWIIPSETAGGVHRLLCGDSTEAEHVKRVMNGERAQLFATDPPYLVDYTGKNRPEATDDEVAEYAQWDSVEDGEAFYSDFLAAAIAEADVEIAIWPECDLPSVVVVLWLVHLQQHTLASCIYHQGVRVGPAELGNDRTQGPTGDVGHEETTVVCVARMERQPEEPRLASCARPRAQIQKCAGRRVAEAKGLHPSCIRGSGHALLYDVDAVGLAGCSVRFGHQRTRPPVSAAI